MDLKKTTFVMACMTFFGKKDGQTTPQFAQELKAIQGQDRTDFVEMFRTVGFDATQETVSA